MFHNVKGKLNKKNPFTMWKVDIMLANLPQLNSQQNFLEEH